MKNPQESDISGLARFVGQRMEMGDEQWFFPYPKNIGAVGNSCSAFSEEILGTENINNTEQSKETPDVDFFASGMPETLDELYKTVHLCKKCSLGNTRKNFVFGVGNPNADIMFIGEAPGEDEDNQGFPFVGRAGQLLNKMIEAIKFKREDVYIGNILKCRPPGNRDPKPDEIELCEPILIRQIELINPKIICALGRISGKTLLRLESTLGALRGIVHRYRGIKLIVTYHPAALLRNPGWKAPAWEDLKFLRREYDGLEL